MHCIWDCFFESLILFLILWSRFHVNLNDMRAYSGEIEEPSPMIPDFDIKDIFCGITMKGLNAENLDLNKSDGTVNDFDVKNTDNKGANTTQPVTCGVTMDTVCCGVESQPPAVGATHGKRRQHPLRYLTRHTKEEDGKLIVDTKTRAAFPRHSFPVCPHCGSPARPAILMFDDFSWVDQKVQRANWCAWKDAMMRKAQEKEDAPLRVAILEIGAGGNVVTVRHTSEHFAHELVYSGAKVSFVRINPDLPLPDSTPDASIEFISMMEKGLVALKAIDEAMHA